MNFGNGAVEKAEDAVDWVAIEFRPYQNLDGSVTLPLASVTFATGLQNLAISFHTTCLNASTLVNVYADNGLVADVVTSYRGVDVYIEGLEGATTLTLVFDSMETWPSYRWSEQDGGQGGGSDWGLGDIVGTLVDAARLLLTLALDALLRLLQVYPLLFAMLSLKYWVRGDWEGWLEFIYMHVHAARTLLRFILDIIDQILPT